MDIAASRHRPSGDTKPSAIAENFIRTRTGRVRAICECCGRISASLPPGDDGQPSMWDLPKNWSTAPYFADSLHDDGSIGSTFTCPSCNERLHRGERLQLRAYLGECRDLVARAAGARSAS